MSSPDARTVLPVSPEPRCPLSYLLGKQKWDRYLFETGRYLCGSSPQPFAAVQKLGTTIAGCLSDSTRTLIGAEWRAGEGDPTRKFACSADFHYVFVLPAAFSEKRIQQLEAVVETLWVQQASGAPAENRTISLLRSALQRGAQGLTERALDALREAESEDATNFVVQLYLGLIQLYAVDDYINLLNLEEAERNLLAAARFSRLQFAHLPDWNEYTADAHFHAGVCSMARAGDGAAAGDAGTRALLVRALDYHRLAEELQPKLSEASFHLARLHALLGDTEQAWAALRRAIAADANYALKADVDPVFFRLRPALNQVFASLRAEAETAFRNELASLSTLQRSGKVPLSRSIAGRFRTAAEGVTVEAALKDRSYFGLLDGVRFLHAIRAKLEQWTVQGLVGEPEVARAQAAAVIARIEVLSKVVSALGLAAPDASKTASLQESLRRNPPYYADILSEAEATRQETLRTIEEHFRDVRGHAVERLEATHDEWVQAQANAEQCHGGLGGGALIGVVLGGAAGAFLGHVLGQVIPVALLGVLAAFGYFVWQDGFVGLWRWRRVAAERERTIRVLEAQVDTCLAVLQKCDADTISPEDVAGLISREFRVPE